MQGSRIRTNVERSPEVASDLKTIEEATIPKAIVIQRSRANYGLLLGLSLCSIAALIIGNIGVKVSVGFLALSLLGCGCGIITLVLTYMYLYRAWEMIQRLPAVRTSPGKAVGFCFIPIFNIYWTFIAWYKWAHEYNRFIELEGRPATQRVNENLFLWAVICQWIPFLYLVFPILALISMAQLCRAINQEAGRSI